MTNTEPTSDELTRAYLAANLRRMGISYQKAITTPCLRIALRCTAIALRNKKPSQTACTNHGVKQ